MDITFGIICVRRFSIFWQFSAGFAYYFGKTFRLEEELRDNYDRRQVTNQFSKTENF
ncbi:hypothetical protein AtDm6_0006 [Acetobacter tropicalis]|uniref:Uncharacterized protein n=1 Tax=Acetobacter tropicalis TaxID=104102 RepID=A0A094YZ22_9PROT|nr:hypothetical protein AtDm6_0006 [Acetobacter tropicalis]